MESSRDGRTQAALAKKVGVSQTTIGRILRGEVSPQADTVQRIAKALGTPVAKLLDKDSDVGVPFEAVPEAADASGVPVISWVQAGEFAETMDPYPLGQGQRRVKCPVRCGPRTFALVVTGESMEPRYHNDDIIYVDPDVPAVHGKDVVVRREDKNEVTFKRLVVEGERRYLKPLNPDWTEKKIIEVSADARIVGVVIGTFGKT